MEQNHKKLRSKKKKTRLIKFGDKKANEIISKKWIKSIKKKLEEIGTYDINSKYYNFLNKKNIYSLKSMDLLFSVNTYGKKMLLFLIKFKNKKNYCIFIDKKTGNMILSRFRFIDDLFDGTLLEGEFVKNKITKKWIFIINDIVYYKGINIITEKFKNRFKILKILIETEFENDNDLSICNIEMKKYFNLNKIKYINDNKDTLFNYKISGLFFKNKLNFSDNYLYTFLECRSDYKLNPKNNLNNAINKSTNNSINNSINYNGKLNNINKKSINHLKSNINRKYVIFEIKLTSLPDVYELHNLNTSRDLVMNSYASIPNNKICKYIRKIFKKKKINDELSSESEISDDEDVPTINIRCYYNNNFKKFVPYKIEYDEPVDNINVINNFIYNN